MQRLPNWTKTVYPHGELEKLSKFSFVQPTYTNYMKKIRSGYLLREILDNSWLQFTNPSKNPSMVMYSAHHNTIANLLHSIGLYTENVSV